MPPINLVYAQCNCALRSQSVGRIVLSRIVIGRYRHRLQRHRQYGTFDLIGLPHNLTVDRAL
jgi:hypothetical protein